MIGRLLGGGLPFCFGLLWIALINGSFGLEGGNSKKFIAGSTDDIKFIARLVQPNDRDYYMLSFRTSGANFGSYINGSWTEYYSFATKSDLPTLERISCKYFNETSLRGEISKDVVNALFVAPIVYNSIGVKVKQVYRTGKTIILLGESFVNTDSLDISVICY